MFRRKATCPSIDAGRQGDGGTAVSVTSILGSQIFPTNILGLGMHFAQSKECPPRALTLPVRTVTPADDDDHEDHEDHHGHRVEDQGSIDDLWSSCSLPPSESLSHHWWMEDQMIIITMIGLLTCRLNDDDCGIHPHGLLRREFWRGGSPILGFAIRSFLRSMVLCMGSYLRTAMSDDFPYQSLTDQLILLLDHFSEPGAEHSTLVAMIDNGGKLDGLPINYRLVWQRSVEPVWLSKLQKSNMTDAPDHRPH